MNNERIIEHCPELYIIPSLDRSGDTCHSSFRGMFVDGDMNSTSREGLQEQLMGAHPL
ncbi:MAG: hypothetical protein U5R06_24705 [candidate division KSB1 bacterium]|nr:hypothetical protein [candidate division KSB1 bacterium]